MSKIVFIVQQLSQPRCIKRIESIVNAGFNYKVFGFNNGLYEENIHALNFEIKELRNIDKSYSKKRKVVEYFKLVLKVIREVEPDDIIYVFGFELGVINLLLRPRNYIYEEADISAARVNNKILKNIMLFLDKRIIKHSYLTVFTSDGFVKYLFKKEYPYSSKIIILRNKLHKNFLNKNRPVLKPINLNKINFGFVGLIRYPNTILRFAKVVGDHFPQHIFHFWGVMESSYLNKEEWKKYPNIIFHGGFKSPNDLERIYKSIDLNIACYDTNSDNVKIAEPNKLYESIFFYKPIVVSKFTFLEERVNELNSGFAIDASKDIDIINFISNIDEHQMEPVIRSMKGISNKDLVICSDDLITAVKAILLSKNQQQDSK